MHYIGLVEGKNSENLDELNRFRALFLEATKNHAPEEIIKYLENEILVPVSIFSNRKLGILEALVKYLRENEGLSLKKTAAVLNRDSRTIWSTYDKAKKKVGRIIVKESDYLVPVSIFGDRSLGVLEVLVIYLKKRYQLRYSQIGKILSRDPRTIWTVYNRRGLNEA